MSGAPATRDLIIVGGGPAGAAAAIEARRHDIDVLVVDKAAFPRDKCCGDGLTTSALRHLEALGADVTALNSFRAIDDVLLVDPTGRSRRFPLPRDGRLHAAVVRRGELDNQLFERARSVGAECREQTTLTAVQSDADGVALTMTDADGQPSVERARFVIAADGMWSPTRRFLGVAATSYRGTWHAFRQYFTGVAVPAQDDLIIWFEPDLLPGYAWSFPLGDGTANVGFGVLRGERRGADLARLWTDLLARPHIREVLGDAATGEARHTAWPIPCDLGRLPLATGRVLFAGDAAAAADPLTGEGIGQALETGRLAAQAINDNADHPEMIGVAYTSVLERGMVRDHALAGWLSAGLGTARGANMSLAVAGLTPWTRRNFARWLFEDYPRAVLGTPRRWSRRLFRSSGAFAQVN